MGIYVHRVSLTHSQNPRKHICTFANTEIHSNQYSCPCTKTDTLFTGVVSPFIDGDYFCDTGSRYLHKLSSTVKTHYGMGQAVVHGTSTCCQFNNPPWFCKQLPQPTTDDIELRLCGDSSDCSKVTAVKQVELYVQ